MSNARVGVTPSLVVGVFVGVGVEVEAGVLLGNGEAVAFVNGVVIVHANPTIMTNPKTVSTVFLPIGLPPELVLRDLKKRSLLGIAHKPLLYRKPYNALAFTAR